MKYLFDMSLSWKWWIWWSERFNTWLNNPSVFEFICEVDHCSSVLCHTKDREKKSFWKCAETLDQWVLVVISKWFLAKLVIGDFSNIKFNIHVFPVMPMHINDGYLWMWRNPTTWKMTSSQHIRLLWCHQNVRTSAPPIRPRAEGRVPGGYGFS